HSHGLVCHVHVVRCLCVFFFQAEDGIRDFHVTGVQTCALPIWAMMDSYRGLFPGVEAPDGMSEGPQGQKDFLSNVLVKMIEKNRSEERRVGKECRCRWGASYSEQKHKKI